MDRIDDDFAGTLASHWKRTCPGGGTLDVSASILRLALPSVPAGRYADAQLDDYSGLRLQQFPWRPPLRLEVRARASHPVCPPLPGDAEAGSSQQTYLRGTAGFGFWNFPLTMAGGVPRLPDALWFFAASPPSNMALVPGIPGRGWKAQVVHAYRWGAVLAGIPALGAVGWAALTSRERVAARWVQRVTGASERLLAAELTEWHDYTIEWRRAEARFLVDGVEVLTAPDPPRGPLGFVAWIDNQYAVATPRGQLRFGTIATGPEWIELDYVRIAPLP
jgi:hypothetical protein